MDITNQQARIGNKLITDYGSESASTVIVPLNAKGDCIFAVAF
jgi:hypothetical protein